jgi:hypothetical protein
MSDDGVGVADRMPVPMGVIATTGETHPQLTSEDLSHITGDTTAVYARAAKPKALALEGAVDDPMDLNQAGWGVLFAADADPAIKDALKPLLNLRAGQVGDERVFKVLDGKLGVRPGQTAAQWASARGVSLSAPVSPKRGVPYYLMIVGSPEAIPFAFQAQLDLQWAVGRLTFDRIEDYASYAAAVVDYERAATITRGKHAAAWLPRNPLDMATALLAGAVGPEFLGQANPGDDPLGTYQKFRLSMFVGDGKATKTTLSQIIAGTIDGGPPSLLFTGSHGAEWPLDTPDIQRQRQGALVTQEWTRGQPLQPDQYFAAADVPAGVDVRGLIAFVFACFGGGCPATDSYYFTADGAPKPLAPAPLIAALPQALLARGALAVIAHIDRAFSYAFEDVMGTPQAQLLRTPLELLMKGKRAGLAADPLNLQWSSLAAQLGMLLGGNTPGAVPPRTGLLANLYIARDDARNYVVLGDPAVRLRTDAMS